MMVRELLKRLEKLNKIKKQTRNQQWKDATVEKTSRSNRKRTKQIFWVYRFIFRTKKKPVTEIETIATIETGEGRTTAQPKPYAKKSTLKSQSIKVTAVYLFGFKIF
jgi:hypothetical protein